MTNANDGCQSVTSPGRSLAALWRGVLSFSSILIALLGATPAQAVYPFTDAEYAMLPEYCHHQGNVSENHRATNSAEWRNILGEDFEPIHHWCAVYMWMGRAYKAGIGSHEGKNMLRMAESDTGYFIKRMARNSPRAAEAFTRLGEVYLLQGKPKQAEPAFKRAHEIDPARWQPYLLWAQFLYKNGQIADARKEISDGLEHAPDSKALKAFLAEMDAGKRGERK